MINQSDINFLKIIDISLPLYEGMIVYPDNTKISIKPEPQATTSRRTQIIMGSHTGTHIDAPAHVIKDGKTLDQIPLEYFVGECRVFDFSYIEFGDAIKISDLEEKNINFAKDRRLLLKTRNSERGFEKFYDNYVYLHGDAAEYLAEREIILVGIDSLSIKQRGSTDNRPHTSLLSRGIPILEGLDLSKVSEGSYSLAVLPLNFCGLDGSPARAVLFYDHS